MTDLKQRRIDAGLTQAELARRAGCQTAYIGGIENGRQKPSQRMMDKLNIVLGGGRVQVKRTPEMQKLYEIWCRDWAGRPEPYLVQVLRRQR